MSRIVCAIRGGADCRSTIDRAVALARESSLPLHFLYVVDLGLLPSTDSSQAEALSETLREMGKSVLAAAQSTALARGVQTEGCVRRGDVGDEIIGICSDLAAEYLVIGSPGRHRAGNVFPTASLRELKARAEQAGVRVLLSGTSEK